MIKKISTAILLASYMFSLSAGPIFALDKEPVPKAPRPIWKHHADARLDDNDGILPDTKAHDDLVLSDPDYVPATGAYSPAVGPSGLFNGIFAGNTGYDYQHNRGSGTQIQNTSRTAFGKRYVHVCWMCLKKEGGGGWDLASNDRQVNYNCYDWNTSGWTLGTDDHGGIATCPAGDRSGYCFMGITDDGNAAVFKHSAPEGAENKSNITIFSIPSLGIYNTYALPNRVGAENIWPTGDVSHKGGYYPAEQDVVHVFADDAKKHPGIATHAYWRYANTGAGYTWRGPYSMDSTNANAVWCFADGDRVIYALAKPIIYSEDDRTHCDLVYYESLTSGADWETAGGPVLSYDNGGAYNTTDFLEEERLTVYNDFHGGFDSEDRLHFTVPMNYRDTEDQMTYVYTELRHWDEGTPGTNENANSSLPALIGEVYPSKEGFIGGTDAHWSIVSRAMWGTPGYPDGLDGAVGAFCSNQCNTSMAFGDGSTICQGYSGDEPNFDYVYIVYTQFGSDDPLDLTDASANGQQNANVWMSISNDNGFSWAAGRCITTDDGTVGGTPTRTPDCDVMTGDTCKSEHWSSCAPMVDDHVHVFYVGDLDAGAIPFGAGAWSLNDLMYYPVPCTDYGDCCPVIAPVLGARITGDADCEYFSDLTEGGINEVKYEDLFINNYGNATLTYSALVNYLPGSGSGWLSLDGSQIIVESTIDKGGDTKEVEVEMDGSGLDNGLWQAEIQITHDDDSKPDPYVLPINFFRADSFICGRGVVMTTPMVALEVSNLESFGRENSEGGMFYYNECSAGCEPDDDSLFNPIFDGSLLIANRTKSQGNTKYVYRDIFTNSTPSNPGYRALEWPKISFDYATYDSVVTANQTTVDSIIGISVRYIFPQEEDPNQSEFVRIMYRIYPRPGGAWQNLVIGAAVDIDCPGSAAGGMGVENVGGFVESYNLVYQHGLDTLRPGGPGTPEFIRETNRYAAGLTSITCEPIRCGWVGCNQDDVYPEGGFDDDTLYLIMEQNYGYWIWADSAEDIYSILAIDEITLGEGDSYVYQIGVVSSVAAGENVAFDDYTHPYDGYVADLIVTTAQAWKKAFGWCTPWWLRYGSTVLEGGSGEIGFVATGTHEDGLAGGCCGCSFSYEINPVPAEGTIYFGPQDGCEGSIVFQDLSYPATYTLTLTVEGLCGDQSDVVELYLETTEEPCDCGVWGDVTGDGRVNPLDLVWMVLWTYHGGHCPIVEPPNCPLEAGDVNCDGNRNSADVPLYIYLIYGHHDMNCPDPCWY